MRVRARLLLLLAALPHLAGWCGADAGVDADADGVDAGPSFPAGQRTEIRTARGGNATLECRVRRLGDRQVSWVRSRDLHILAHAGLVFTGDARVAVPHAAHGTHEDHESRHALRVARLRPADAGRYECQLNTEPKMSLFFHLTVTEKEEPAPNVEVRVWGGDGDWDAEGQGDDGDEQEVVCAAGGAVTLACEARLEGETGPAHAPLALRWLRDGRPLDLREGGLSVERWGSAARSSLRLTAAGARATLAGRYACAAYDPDRDPDGAVPAASAALRLRVVPAPNAPQLEAMQRDQAGGLPPAPAAGPAARSRPPPLLPLLLLLPLLPRTPL